MKAIIFSLIILLSSVCYGQLPPTKDKLFILVTSRNTCDISRNAERQFANPGVLKYLADKNIQLIHYYGEDLTREWRKKVGLTHYPALIYLAKKNDQYVLVKTVSGVQHSMILTDASRVRWLLGMKAETYLANPELIPQSQPQVQQVAPPQQYYVQPQQQWGSAPPST